MNFSWANTELNILLRNGITIFAGKFKNIDSQMKCFLPKNLSGQGPTTLLGFN
jgi:small nuclear ribonucleoprotein (snRNP)-like protein